jgi:biopolymer transport protein ExbD
MSGRFSAPIKSPGPRLLRGVPFRFLQSRLRQAGRGRAIGFELPLVSFVDCLLCLVLFLLASFSAEATCQRGVEVPGADNTLEASDAPVVTVNRTQIMVDGAPAGSSRDVMEGARLTRVEPLFDALRNKRELWRQLNPGREFPGTVVLQIDRQVPSLVVKSVFQTAAFAGFPRVSFMVERR